MVQRGSEPFETPVNDVRLGWVEYWQQEVLHA